MSTTIADIAAREIWAMTRPRLWSLPEHRFRVTYDCGETQMLSKRQVIFDRYFWEMFYLYPQAPITRECTVRAVVGAGHFNANTHMRLFEVIFQHIVHHQSLESYEQKQPLLECIYDIVDMLHNEVIEHAAADVFTIDANDLTQVATLPALVELAAKTSPTPDGIERAYRTIRQIINEDTSNNNFMRAYRCKAINDNQANQCIGPRGFVTDLDRTVFRQPVMGGFIRGLDTLYDVMVEGCTAAKSLVANTLAISTSEYTSRRLQLQSMIVQRVVMEDCGSTEYMDVLIDDNNLETLKGKYYALPEGGQDWIRGKEKHLVGEIVKVRTILGCRHPQASRVCRFCAGELMMNFKISTNLGYTLAAYVMEMISQSILSTKHLTHSVRKSLVSLEGIAAQFLHTDENGDVFLNAQFEPKGITLVLPGTHMRKLVDVLNLDHSNIALSKIGELEHISLIDGEGKKAKTYKLCVAYRDRPSVLTRYFVDYIRKERPGSDARGNFLIPLDNIDKTQPLFNIPLKETNILNFVTRFSNIIEKDFDKITDPYKRLQALYETTMEKFRVNIAALEVLIYSTTAYNAPASNYRLARNSPIPMSVKSTTLFRNRDFGALCAYEHQYKAFTNHPRSIFGDRPRDPHPMSVFFLPQQVVENLAPDEIV